MVSCSATSLVRRPFIGCSFITSVRPVLRNHLKSSAGVAAGTTAGRRRVERRPGSSPPSSRSGSGSRGSGSATRSSARRPIAGPGASSCPTRGRASPRRFAGSAARSRTRGPSRPTGRRRTPCPRHRCWVGPLIGSGGSTITCSNASCNSSESCTLAPVTTTATGPPSASTSVSSGTAVPFFARSVGFGPT